MTDPQPAVPLFWAYHHTGLHNWGLASVEPTRANCYLETTARAQDTLKVVELRLLEAFDPVKEPDPVQCCWVWHKPGMSGWAIGKIKPDMKSRHYQDHPEEFEALTILPMYFYGDTYEGKA